MYEILVNNKLIQLLVIFITLDVIFGILGSIKQKKTNSTIGIDGILRKIGMIFSIAGCILIDSIVEIDLLTFIPQELKNYLNLGRVGTASLFAILYSLFEILSIFKNMMRCKIPLPAKLQKLIYKLLNDFTNEVKDGELNEQ